MGDDIHTNVANTKVEYSTQSKNWNYELKY